MKRALLVLASFFVAPVLALPSCASAQAATAHRYTCERWSALYTERSHPTESMDQFVLRIASRAVRTGRQIKSEVCGVIGKTGGLYHITIGTSRTPRHCCMRDANNYMATFHTHPDYATSFSKSDYSEPGFMAIKHAVWYQDGVGTQHKVISNP